MTIVIEGKTNRAAIYKEGVEFKKQRESLEDSMEDLPPEGFM